MKSRTANQLGLATATRVTVLRLRAGELVERMIKDERGEIGSWLLLAAGLAVAAAAAVAVIGPWIDAHVQEIKKS